MSLGALLAASAFSDEGPVTQFAALVFSGALAADSHALKAGVRAVIDASPEPVSYWIASLSEDFLALGGIPLALQRPDWFISLLGAFVAGTAIGLYFAWSGIRALAGRIAGTFGRGPSRQA